MQEVEIIKSEKDLLEYFQWLRLMTAKTINDQNIEASKSIKEEKRTAKGTAKNLGKFFKREFGQYGKKDETINDELYSFNCRHASHLSDNEAQMFIKSLFESDQNGLSKLLMGISVILDNQYTYKYEKEGLEAVSTVLYGKKEELATIKKQLEENYNAISPKSLSAVQKGALMGVAVLSLVGVIALPILLGGGVTASAATTTASLATHGFGDMQIGLGIISAEALLMSAALTGITYGSMKLYNSLKTKEAFKKLDPEKSALYLAIQCTFIQRVRKTMDDQRFKEVLDQILKSLATLKQDLDYYLFIEKESTEVNKKKLKFFHDFDGRLEKILGI